MIQREMAIEYDERLRDLHEWLEEFTDILKDAEVPASAHISQDSDSERPTKAVSKSRMHSFLFTSQKTELAKSGCQSK